MELLKENEISANKAAANVMGITVIIFAAVLVLDILGIFTVAIEIMIAAFIIGTILLLVPMLLTRILKISSGWVKYVIVLCAVLFTFILTAILSYHVVLLYVYPIAIASLYFSGRLNAFVTVLTVVGVSVGQILSFNFDFITDNNYTELKKVIVSGIVPRAMILFAISAIFIMLCKRTAGMLGSLMGAEQQKAMREKSLEVSTALLETVTQLDGISAASSETNRSIADESEKVMRDSEENTNHIKSVEENMRSISVSLNELSDMSSRIEALTRQADEITSDNNAKMSLAAESMEQIYKGTDESKEIIVRLSEQSEKIVAIADVITEISIQTNILALNAAVEASHAGEHGKGFSVVASEIKRLSEQTKTAAANIAEIIGQVTENISGTVAAMEKNAELTRQGMVNMEHMKKSTQQITLSNNEISGHVADMNAVIRTVAESGENASGELVSVSGNIENNSDALRHVASAIEENSASTENLNSMVRKIKSMAEELSKSVT